MFRKWIHTAGYAVLLTIAALALMQAGPLDPIAPPGPTMKTLDEIPPTWSQALSIAQRFVVVLSGEAVLDKETGLVWDRSPSEQGVDWLAALDVCYRKTRGNRAGWRLPSIAELSSLSVPNALNSSSPFDFDCTDNACVDPIGQYWSSTTLLSDPTRAYAANTFLGGPGIPSKTLTRDVWCVRGGSGIDSGR
jgi:hypothetical protein